MDFAKGDVIVERRCDGADWTKVCLLDGKFFDLLEDLVQQVFARGLIIPIDVGLINNEGQPFLFDWSLASRFGSLQQTKHLDDAMAWVNYLRCTNLGIVFPQFVRRFY